MPEGYDYRAIAPITAGFTRIFNAGDPVPTSTVEGTLGPDGEHVPGAGATWVEDGLVERHDYLAPDAIPFDAAKAAVDIASIATAAQVSEAGPELAELPKGTTITTDDPA